MTSRWNDFHERFKDGIFILGDIVSSAASHFQTLDKAIEVWFFLAFST